jgi:ribonuclease HI
MKSRIRDFGPCIPVKPVTVVVGRVGHAVNVNHAYADGSQQGEVGGWGVVMLVPGQPDTHHSGLASVRDNGACELLAVLEAVRRAPEGQPLTVHTDATGVVQAVRRGTRHPEQTELGAEVRRVAQERGIQLRLSTLARDARRMREAHQLATDARLGIESTLALRRHVRVRVRHLGWGAQATLTFRRGGTTQRRILPLPEQVGVPPALLALAALVRDALDDEHLVIRMDSALAPTVWNHPDHAPHPAAAAVVRAARQDAETRRITVEFDPPGRPRT